MIVVRIKGSDRQLANLLTERAVVHAPADDLRHVRTGVPQALESDLNRKPRDQQKGSCGIMEKIKEGNLTLTPVAGAGGAVVEICLRHRDQLDNLSPREKMSIRTGC